MKNFSLLAALALPLLLDGCYTPLIEGAQEGYDVARRDSLEADTATGDPVAQYKLGDTYCCHGGGPMDRVSVYDNSKATYWYCRSARQGYGPAQLRLAQVYAGHPIHGLHMALRASALVDTVNTDLGVALMWARLAATHGGGDDAVELRDEIMAHATNKDRARAAALMENWRAAPCRWAAVFPSARNTR
jgi:TPR repeat protein